MVDRYGNSISRDDKMQKHIEQTLSEIISYRL